MVKNCVSDLNWSAEKQKTEDWLDTSILRHSNILLHQRERYMQEDDT